MSTFFHFGSGETEKRSKVRFGFKSRFGRLDSQICARIVDPASSVSANSATVGDWNRSKRMRDSPVSSNCRAVECAVRSAERDPLGTADATVDPEAANFVATRKFHVR